MIVLKSCSPTIDQLYNSRFSDNDNEKFKVSAEFSESVVPFGIVLTGGDKQPDCKVSSFHDNIYFRTKNGENGKRYSTIKGLAKAVRTIAKKYGYTYKGLIIEKGEPNRI